MASEVQIRVGDVLIGGGAPVVVQSMTLTKTHDVPATTAQIAALASAGCEVVRVAVPKNEDAAALPLIVRLSPIPVIADIHFNASLALKAIEAGVAAVRINPGNIGSSERVAEVEEVGEGVTASDEEVGRAVAFAFRELKLVVEPGGAIGLAALLAGKLDIKGKVVVAVLSGGDVDSELFNRLIAA